MLQHNIAMPRKKMKTNSLIESEQPLNFGMNLSEFMDSAIRFKIQ